MDPAQRKAELSALLDQQRGALSRSSASVKGELSVGHQLKRSIQQKPLAWFAGSLGTAAVLGFLLKRPKIVVEKKRRGLIGSAVRLGFIYARPTLTKWAIERARTEVRRRISHPE